MINEFNNGKIYKLTSNQTDEVYIGSTTKKLSERLGVHKSDYKYFLKKGKGSHYITSFDLLKYDDCKIILLEAVNVETQEELFQYEAKYIKLHPNCVNKVMPGQTDHEYYLANKEHKIAYAKQYAEEHPEETKRNAKKFRETHKEEVNAKQKEVIDCSCGDTYTRSNKLYHYDTPKHKKFVETGIVEDKTIIPLTQVIICPCGSDHTYANHLRHAETDVHKRYEAKKAIADANGVELTMEEVKAPPKCDCGYTKYPITQQRHITSQQHIIFMKNKAIVEAGGVVTAIEVLPKNKNGRTIKPNVICECGGDYPSRNRKRHLITLMHKNFVAKNTPKGAKLPIIENNISGSDESSGIEDEEFDDEYFDVNNMQPYNKNQHVAKELKKPMEKKPEVNKPVIQKSVENKPVVQKPIEKKPAVKKSIEKKPEVKKSIENKPVVQKTEEDKSTVKKPANKKLRKFDL